MRFEFIDLYTVEALGRRDLGRVVAHVLEQTTLEQPPTGPLQEFRRRTYYAQGRDRLVEVAATTAGIPPVTPAPGFGDAGDGSLTEPWDTTPRDPPRRGTGADPDPRAAGLRVTIASGCP